MASSTRSRRRATGCPRPGRGATAPLPFPPIGASDASSLSNPPSQWRLRPTGSEGVGSPPGEAARARGA
eukprot:1092542-Alexandrium_andersonii.AAC.1